MKNSCFLEECFQADGLVINNKNDFEKMLQMIKRDDTIQLFVK